PRPARSACADTVSKVIHKRRRKAIRKPSSPPAPIVNNFAADEETIVNNLPSNQSGSGRKTPRPARSACAFPPRDLGRKPAGSRASVQRSPQSEPQRRRRPRPREGGPESSNSEVKRLGNPSSYRRGIL